MVPQLLFLKLVSSRLLSPFLVLVTILKIVILVMCVGPASTATFR
jgi:hypothetical protein